MTKEDKIKLNNLVKRISNGDKDAFEDIYSLMYNVLYCFLRRYWNNQEIIKDTIIATFETVFEKSKTKLFFTNCYNWILTISRNHLKNILRKEGKTILLDESDLQQEYNIDMNPLTINLLLDNLTTTDRQLIYLKYHEGLKLKEMSRMTKLSESTIKRRLDIIYNYLKENLDENEQI